MQFFNKKIPAVKKKSSTLHAGAVTDEIFSDERNSWLTRKIAFNKKIPAVKKKSSTLHAGAVTDEIFSDERNYLVNKKNRF